MTTTDRIAGLNGSVGFKAPCRAATTAAITLSGEQTIDGVAIVAGDRVLVKDQSSGVDNGIYLASAGSWSRALDFDGERDARNGTMVYVTSGSTNGGDIFAMSATDPVTLGTTAVTFSAVISLTSASAYIQTLLDDADAATAQTTLGGTTTGKALFTAASAADARTTLGLGSLATASAIASANITDDTIVNADINSAAAIAASKLGTSGTPSTAAQFLGGDSVWRDRVTSGTAVASTSGTAIDFTGIPSWVKVIVIQLVGVSTNGTASVGVQIGDSGGIENSGYSGTVFDDSTTANFLTGFFDNTASAAIVRHGTYTLTLVNAATWTWACTFTLGFSNAAAGRTGGGTKSLTATLDRVRLTASNGTDAFDAGTVNILYW